MAYAHLYGAGFGFGLGFLNLLGTLLFFALVFGGLRFFSSRGRYRGPWRGGRRHSRGGWAKRENDEAISTARARFAEGEMSAEEFGAVKKGLREDRQDHQDEEPRAPWAFSRGDEAMNTARMRLARSEITPEEFETLKQTLQD